MVSEPLPKIDRFGTPHASVNYPEELDDCNASLTIRSVGLVIHGPQRPHPWVPSACSAPPRGGRSQWGALPRWSYHYLVQPQRL